jgi:hypothetical protein
MSQQQNGSLFLDMFKYYDTLKYYSPWTNWQRFFNPQFFISYNTDDVEVENHVLSQAGSYGKQLGQIMDVLNILICRLPKERLTAQERETLQDFRALSKQVDSAVTAVKGPQSKGITLSDIDQLVDQLTDLKQSDHSTYRLLIEHIQH